MDLYNDDCFNVFPKIKDKTINLFLLDLPYGQTSCKWDSVIDLHKMWIEIKRMMKPNGIIIFFCTAKFGNTIINSNPKWFKYDLIWKKSRKVGFLSANKQPLREHENIYVFNGNAEDNQEGKIYAKKILDYIGKTKTQINKILGHRKAEHFFYFKEDVEQFSFPTEDVYNELIKHFKIDEMTDFIPFLNITYNPQKTEGKPYKSKERIETDGVYIKDSYKRTATKDTTNRHPTSIIENTILEYNNPAKSLHRTQKPVELCEWLIKTYTNEDDVVMDFTMGSGTTGVACINTNREFIGVEMDKEIFEIAETRILDKLKDL